MSGGSQRLAEAIAAIDAANADDPTIITARGRTGPKEVVHGELVTEWVQRLRPDADEALLLAARGHHLRRWTMPRASYPTGRAGYLRWRRALHQQHAHELGDILHSLGYDTATTDRVQALVRKEGLGRPGGTSDPDVQALEDALCLVFLETQLAELTARLDDEKLVAVLAKTAAKMSDTGRAAIASLTLEPTASALLERALAPPTAP